MNKLCISLLLLTQAFLCNAQVARQEINCLATNMYYEARGEGVIGMYAVGLVTRNRVNSELFKHTSYCEIVYQRSQFSWTLSKPKKPIGKSWEHANVLANLLYKVDRLPDITGGALYFFNPKMVTPYWARKFTKTVELGNHHYYKT